MTAARIRELPLDQVALIAAGEVVERPASAVKELLENSLDAKATRIAVALQGGGCREIRVADNGIGVHPDDFPLLCAPHATSKIGRVADLHQRKTLGFRGEALAALARVADLRIQSRQGDGPGVEALYTDGAMVSCRPAGAVQGALVVVQDLFHRLPARLRFLGAPAAEAARCRRVVLELALAHPKVAFSLEADGRRLLRTSGSHGERDLAALAWNPEAAIGALEVAAEGPGWRVEGLLARPDHASASPGGLFVSINGRAVRMASLAALLRREVAPWMGAGLHPRAILRFTVDPSRLDVNVHPAKARVAMDAPGWEARVVESARDALAARLGAPALRVGLAAADRPLGLREPVTCLGLAFSTMLVYTQGDDLILLDGHAASERIVFEHLLQGLDNLAAEPLLEPRRVDVPADPAGRRAFWERLGLEWEEGPDGWLVTGAPPAYAPAALGPLLEGDGENPEALLEGLRTGACHAAWRGGMRLGKEGGLALWAAWAKCRDPWTCPHGRRVAVRLSRPEAERLFQRTGPG
ncbi:DNA mismatch repair endonuclease MutL [bacterium]|nr:DNA mismatch repair endonuclease MutL [bacterium]